MNIFALSSGRGPSGIAIIRISGKNIVDICNQITKNNKLLFKEINYCKFYDPATEELIDEGILLLFKGPKSFTGEDLAEFHIHGSNAIISRFLNILSHQSDCRLAEPGEFTKIAFQNNKIDLVEAESIGDLINSETELQRQQAIKLVQGNASVYYNILREKLIKSLAFIEAKIDFAEDNIPEKILQDVQISIKEVHKDIKKIIDDNKIGEKIRDGFRVSIIGEVNSGKSSLLNLLAKRDVAIVSEEEGTTRDVIEIFLNINGYPVIIADTAGIRETKNSVEKKGISLALNKAKDADLNIIMIDNGSSGVNHNIKNLINKNSIVLLNKCDINNKQNFKLGVDTILISVTENKNIDQFVEKLTEKLNKKFSSNNSILITRERHRLKLEECLKEIDNFLKKDQYKDIDLAAEDLRMATRHLSSIVGKIDVEEILGSIFKDFCIGK
ncbi:tRNA uridine-5-carboxymethylaminomethyl(34) synthesis GTPase MnmE [Pelagibacteraceae bacterium]|nr:tRNA uridine-5-carboxymethylaminomethyl(34) synthesis GTPase MnmE [Pelagibacteraceae bacterium]